MDTTTSSNHRRITPENGISLKALTAKVNELRGRYGEPRWSDGTLLLYITKRPELGPSYESAPGVSRVRRDWTPEKEQVVLSHIESELLEKKLEAQRREEAEREAKRNGDGAQAALPIGDAPRGVYSIVRKNQKDVLEVLKAHSIQLERIVGILEEWDRLWSTPSPTPEEHRERQQ
jgi:hypothetical protein